MESIVESSLKNSTLVLSIVILLYVAISELKMTERMRITLIYIFASFLAFAGSLGLRYVCIGAFVVPFLVLEFLSDDTKRQELFVRVDYKVIDFLYRMFIEYAYVYFALGMTMLFISHRWFGTGPAHILTPVLASVFFILALMSVSAKKYSTKSINNIIDYLEMDVAVYQVVVTPKVELFFKILIGMEDRTYFERSERQHTLRLRDFIAKGFSYAWRHASWRLVRSMKTLWFMLTRGYSTIEMQLLRSIGLESGYGYTLQRKIFEFIYANMLFNGYRTYLARSHVSLESYRAFILLKYIGGVDVGFKLKKYRPYNGRSTLLQMFNVSDINEITKEQFFVWCLGLPQKSYIYPATLDYYTDFMARFNIDQAKVKKILAIYQ